MAATVNRPTEVVGRRVGAFVIDFLLTGVLYWGLFFLFAERRESAPTEAVQANLTLGDTTYAISGSDAALFFMVFLLVGLAYWAVLPGATGWTIGKLLTGVRVVGAGGELPAGVGRNLLRQLVGVADYFPYFLPGLTGFVIALTNDGRQRLGDMAAKTHVVHRDAAGQRITAASQPTAAAAAAPMPGWYPDPSGQARVRWWDGRVWTDHASA